MIPDPYHGYHNHENVLLSAIWRISCPSCDMLAATLVSTMGINVVLMVFHLVWEVDLIFAVKLCFINKWIMSLCVCISK